MLFASVLPCHLVADQRRSPGRRFRRGDQTVPAKPGTLGTECNEAPHQHRDARRVFGGDLLIEIGRDPEAAPENIAPPYVLYPRQFPSPFLARVAYLGWQRPFLPAFDRVVPRQRQYSQDLVPPGVRERLGTAR